MLVVLGPAASVRGTVLDAEGRPVSKAWVLVYENAEADRLAGSRGTHTGNDGEFELRDLDPESGGFLIARRGREDSPAAPFHGLLDAQATVTVELRFPAEAKEARPARNWTPPPPDGSR